MKTAIASILTDTHLGDNNIEINKSIYAQAIEITKSYGLNQIEHGGDIFNSRKAQSQPTLIAFKEILDDLYKNGIILNSCVGNHDKTNYASNKSFLDPFSKHPAFNLYSEWGIYRKIGDKLLCFASYFTDEIYIEKIAELKKAIKPNHKHILITHIGISGSVMNNGTVIESESITPSLFLPFDLTLVGHFHDAQILAGGAIKYIGASLQHDYGELTGKGLTILFDDLSTEIIPLKYQQYIKYEVSPKDITKADIDDLKAEIQQSGDNIRLILTGTNAELKSFNKQILIDAGLSVQRKAEDINREKLEQRVHAFDVKGLKEEFQSFCEKNNLDFNAGMKYFNHIIK